jgi:hypothetical protein
VSDSECEVLSSNLRIAKTNKQRKKTTIKLKEEINRIRLHDLELGKRFLDITLKSQAIRKI